MPMSIGNEYGVDHRPHHAQSANHARLALGLACTYLEPNEKRGPIKTCNAIHWYDVIYENWRLENEDWTGMLLVVLYI